MNVIHMACAVSFGSNRKQERGTHQIAQLDCRVVVAGCEGWQLKDPPIVWGRAAEFLCENGMRDTDVFQVIAAIRYTKSEIILPSEKFIKRRVERLNGKRIHRDWVECPEV